MRRTFSTKLYVCLVKYSADSTRSDNTPREVMRVDFELGFGIEPLRLTWSGQFVDEDGVKRSNYNVYRKGLHEAYTADSPVGESDLAQLVNRTVDEMVAELGDDIHKIVPYTGYAMFDHSCVDIALVEALFDCIMETYPEFQESSRQM